MSLIEGIIGPVAKLIDKIIPDPEGHRIVPSVVSMAEHCDVVVGRAMNDQERDGQDEGHDRHRPQPDEIVRWDRGQAEQRVVEAHVGLGSADVTSSP